MDEDAFRETRRLRAAADRTRNQQRTAMIGGIASAMCVRYGLEAPMRDTALSPLLLIAAPLILVASLVPFYSARCPKCRRRLHAATGLFHSANTTVCHSCGFDFGKHIAV